MSKYDNASLVQIPSGYKASTLYSVLPQNGDGDFDFTRGSTATRVNENGLIESVGSNVPRLDYPLLDGVVQSCPALLLEPSRTNLITYSEAFDNAVWNKSGLTVTANDAISPDGEQTADKLVFSSTSDYCFFEHTTTSSVDFTFSIWLKSDSVKQIKIRIQQSGGATTDNVVLVNTIWNKYEVTHTASSPTFIRATINPISGDEEFYAWGAQLEASSYATSYIPTSGTTVTRSADVCNGAGTSAEFNDSEGVLFAEISGFNDTSIWRFLGIHDGSTANNWVAMFLTGRGNANELRFDLRVGGVFQASEYFTVPDITSPNKYAIKYKENDFAVYVNGFEVITDSLASVFATSTLTELAFNRPTGVTEPFYGNTKQLATFNVALSDTQLEDLTSWDSFAEMAQSQLYTIE